MLFDRNKIQREGLHYETTGGEKKKGATAGDDEDDEDEGEDCYPISSRRNGRILRDVFASY